MRRALPLVFGAALLLTAAPAGAATAPDPLGSGSTTLTLAAPFKRLLAVHGVALAVSAPGTRKGSAYTLPLAEGEVNPTGSNLALETQGSLIFARAHRQVIFRHLNVKTARVPLLAKVGGGQLKIASSAKRSFSRQGFDSSLSATGLRLTAKVATRLSKKLALRGVFKGGQLLGTLGSTVAPATVAVEPTGRLTLTLEPAFVAKLNSLFVSLNPVAPAERLSSTLFTVPFIPAGTIAPDASSGIPRTGGSLEFLQLGAGQVFWHELWFDFGGHQILAEVDEEPTPAFPGKLGQLPILTLAPGSVTSDPTARTVSVGGAALSLTSQAATQFNEAFAKPQGKANVFQSGEAVGSVSFTAQTH